MTDKHTNILIRIHSRDEDSDAYPFEAELDDGSRFLDGELNLDQQALQAVESDPEQYGLDLFYNLFSGPVRRAYDKATGRAEAQTGGRLRVRLWIDNDAAELHALPWERIYHVHRGQSVPMAISTLTPFSRYTGLEIPEPEPVTSRPIRMLIAISNPHNLEDSGLSPIDVAQEVENLRQALGDLQQGGQIHVTLIPGQSGLSAELRAQLEDEGYQIQDGMTSLDNIMQMLPDCHIFHFLGHGAFRRRGDRGEGVAALYLEKDDGSWQGVRDDDIVSRLVAAAPALRLVFLAACESAKRDAKAAHPFVGLAPKLVKAGVPAVVAMQDQVSITLAQELTGSFYRRLLEHGEIDRALNEARSTLFDQKKTDWAIPVLFMRLEQGQLFAADPIRLTLQAIRAHELYRPWPKHRYLPIEVVHTTGQHDASSLEQLQRESVPAVNMVEETLNLFSTRRLSSTEGERDHDRSTPLLVGLVGGHGMTKSTQLCRIAWITADRSLNLMDHGIEHPVIPVYVDLQNYSSTKSSLGNPIETLMLESLEPFWPGLTAERLSELLRRNQGPILRVLLDGSDDMPDSQRIQAWDALQILVDAYPHHEYMLSTSPGNLDPRQLAVTNLLVIQPLSQRTVKQFLKGLNTLEGRRLYGALSRAQLFDLAANPWLLVNMLVLAQAGVYPESRTKVLKSLVEDGIASIPNEYGMRSRAERTLTALAWEMQSTRSNTWPVSDAFRTFAAIRGNREYSLENFYDALVSCGLLVQVGQESMRFAYPPIHAYCCARAILDKSDHIRVIDDITATLGRLTRLRWWEDTLVLVSGLMDDPNELIRTILYGATLAGGEQPLLAANCLLESGERQIDPDLIEQIIDALIWQLDSTNERSVQRRARAASTLGQLAQLRRLQSLSAIPHLVRIANQESRVNWRGEARYEYSNVRMAAAGALQHMRPIARDEVKAADPQLDEVLYLWSKENVKALNEHLHAKDEGIQAIAALALGDLQTPQTVDILIAAFFDADTESNTRWAVTDALALLDPAMITRRAILPLLNVDAAERESLDPDIWERRADWYGRLAYLIGMVRAREPIARDFLERCLHEFIDVRLTADAVQSLGWMYERSYKDLFERIALGDFEGIASSEKASEWDSKYLQRKAIEALANIGDRETLTQLRTKRTDWGLELERIFYWTSEEIYWRLGS
ncbi:MAG: CHAT domain-containing protein [Chloroflexi bacterium]|nr:CHAT domain-containing protein [Chloroflexota bacterium]